MHVNKACVHLCGLLWAKYFGTRILYQREFRRRRTELRGVGVGDDAGCLLVPGVAARRKLILASIAAAAK